MEKKPTYEELEQRVKEFEKEAVHHKHAEEDLPESEEKYHTSYAHLTALLENTDDYILISDRKGLPVMFNSAYARSMKDALGIDMKPGLQPHKLLPDKDAVAFWDNLHRRVLSGETFREEYSYEFNKGDVRHFEISYHPIIENGEVTGFSELTRDISERKQAEEALRENEEKYRSLFESMLNGFAYCKILLDENNHPIDFVYLEVNDFFERLTGLKKEDVVGKRVTQVIPSIKDTHPELFDIYGKVALTGKETQFEIYFEPLEIWLSISVYSPQKEYFVTIFENITQRKQAKESLQKRTYDLGKRVKELNCLYGISHLVEKSGISLEDILQETVDLIPPSWQYPEITCARAIVEGQELKTDNFRDTIWKQTNDIIVHGEPAGVLTVCYLEEKPESDEGPFLREERNLINAIAERLGNIIERSRGEEALRESETKYRSLVEQIPAVIYIAELDETNTILYISPQIETLLGFSQAEYRDDPDIWRKQLHPEDKERVLVEVARSRENSKPFALEYRMLTRDGRVVWLRDESVIAQDAAGKPLYLQGLMFDVSERRQAGEHIHALNQQLMKAQENERQLISCELHDQVAQDLSTLKITCETLLGNQSEVPFEVRQGLSELSRTLQKIIKTVRDLSYDLRPSSLDQLGLVRTVFQYCEDFSTKNGANVDFSSAGMDSLSLDFDTEINLYRLIQEGLNNIKKHADASHVTIRLVASSPKIILRIEDDGKGFNVKDRLIAAFHEKRMGLRSMEERVGLLQGKMRIQSSQAKGTRILVEIPYKEKKGDSQEEHIYR